MNSAKKNTERSNLKECPFLDTINRDVLDFDCEKKCSVSLSKSNIYICLVCGSYFQGRRDTTPAFSHSIQMDHHVFMNIETKRFYCLPDNYEFDDPSLENIRLGLDPIFTEESIKSLDQNDTVSVDTLGFSYVPGIMGINVLDHSGYINVVVQALSQVKLLRDFFLLPSNYAHCTNKLVQQFGILMRKIWSPYRLRRIITPQEFINEVIYASQDRFNIQKSQDILMFLTWFINYLHTQLKDNEGKSIMTDCFRGQIEMTTITYLERQVKRIKKDTTAGPTINNEEVFSLDNYDEDRFEKQITKKTIPCFFLSLDLPPIPLFPKTTAHEDRRAVQTISLFQLLEKYNGEYITHDAANNVDKQFKIKQLPKYLLFTIPRFKSRSQYTEKNNAIINFPINFLDMKPYVNMNPSQEPTKEQLVQYSIKQLKELLAKYHVTTESIIEKEELIELSQQAIEQHQKAAQSTKYNLIFNAVYAIEMNREATVKQTLLDIGFYKCHVRNYHSKKWYEIQDCNMHEIESSILYKSETMLLVYSNVDYE